MFKRIVLASAIMIVMSGSLPGTRAEGQSREEGMQLYHEGRALYNEARSEEDMQRAAEKIEQALKIFEMLKFDKGIGDTTSILGVIYAKSGQYAKAREYWAKSLEIFGKLGDVTGERRVLNNLGLVHADLGQYPEAAEHYEKSLEIARQTGDPRGEGATLNNLGNVYNVWGQHSKALECYEKSLQIAREIGDMKMEAGTLNSIGLVHKAWGHYPEAAEHYEKSLEIAGKVGDLEGEARSLNNLGNLYNGWGQYSKAVEYYEQSLTMFRKLGDLGGEGAALSNLGLVYTDWGHYSKAVEYYERSLSIKAKLGDVRGEGITLGNLGNVCADTGQYSKAEGYYEKSLTVFKRLADLGGQGAALNNLGIVYAERGHYSKAVEYYEKALEIARKLGDAKGEGATLNNVGLVHAAWGLTSKAVEYYEQSLAIKTRLGDVWGQGATLMNLGRIYALRGEYEKALANFQTGLSKSEQMGVPLGWPKKLLGDLYLDMGDAEKAEPLLTEAGHSSSLGRLRLLKADYWGARGFYEKLRQFAENNRDVGDLFTAYTGLGMAYEGIGDNKKAEEYFLQAIDLTEALRSSLSKVQRESFFDVRINGFLRTAPYDGLARVRVRMNRPLEAFKVSEHTKSRIFAEAMSKRSESTSFDIPADVLNKDMEVNDQVAALKKKRQEAYEKTNQEAIAVMEPQVKEKERELLDHINMLRENYPLFAATKYPRPMGLDETALRPNEWVLAYHVTDTGIITYLTRGKEIVKACFKPISRGELDSLVLKFRNPLEIVPGRDTFDEKLKSFDLVAGKKVSDLLLSDSLEKLPRDVPVMVVPDDSLGTLPFEVLVLNDGGTIEAGKDLPYVSGAEFFGDRNRVAYCQSVTALTLGRIHAKARGTQTGLLAIADPVFHEKDDRTAKVPEKEAPTGVMASLFRSLMAAEESGQMGGLKFSRLSLTGELASALADMHKKGSEVYTGFDASKSNFLNKISPSLDHYDKIVFATHGYFGADLPGIMEPVLVLTLVPPGTDGYLRMTEVMGLNMNADIVALTACQSGLGKRTAGEGTMGMGRAFQYAGAKSVLMSLWSVSEVSSVNLVKSFFRNIKDGKSKSEALVLARRDIRKKGFDHPFFWAGFILVGEEN
ncbi:MAG TPA: tetratricopeptide repeat protein [Desulfomonilaceae bacterium]|nr:tetratricopeptide repeat protein [Desulfomonilaceae bacterium]